MIENKDDVYMRQILELAKKACGDTSPNPMVGALIVKNNKVISRGYHKRSGLPHAEIEAFNKIKKDISGSTLYVNLEPCCHFGKTGPCVDEVIKRKIKRVVVCTIDPNPLMAGKSIKKMRAAGIDVTVGVLAREAEKLNEVFFHNMKKNMPYVAAKCAMSLDGKIASPKGISKWITSQESRDFARSLRDKYDAVLVGVNTVIKDDPKLDGLRKIPYKIVVDPDLRLPVDSFLVKNSGSKLLIITLERNLIRALKKFPQSRAIAATQKKNRLELAKALKKLYTLGITSVFAEGGADTLGGFFDTKLVNKVYFFYAPKIIGGKMGLSAIGAEGFPDPQTCPVVKDLEIKRLGPDFLVSGYPQY
jgi:diaminohydroxyphosphoribosylaminopyrimidine deaminase/5-amino-6-(5-phosphoribosylamino)uracil reductase